MARIRDSMRAGTTSCLIRQRTTPIIYYYWLKELKREGKDRGN